MAQNDKFGSVQITSLDLSHNKLSAALSRETKKLLDKPRLPHYHGYKGISDSKLVFDLQDQQQKFSKKLRDLLADYIKLLGLHVF